MHIFFKRTVFFIIFNIFLYQNCYSEEITIPEYFTNNNSIKKDIYLLVKKAKKKEVLKELAIEKNESKKREIQKIMLISDFISIANTKTNNLKNKTYFSEELDKNYSFYTTISSYQKEKKIISAINIKSNINKYLNLGSNISINMTYPNLEYKNIKQSYYNINAGLYGYLQYDINQKNHWFIKPSLTILKYKLDAIEENNNKKIGKNIVLGTNFSIQGGKNIIFNNDININCYFSYNILITAMKNNLYYQNLESNYKYFSYKDHSIRLGGEVKIPLRKKLNWITGFQIENTVDKRILLNNEIKKIKSFENIISFSKLKKEMYSNINYSLNKYVSISVQGGIVKTKNKKIEWDGSLNISGKF